MKLLIDIGNTSSKIAVANGDEFVHHERLAEPWSAALKRLYETYRFGRIVVSCVGHDGIALQEALATWLTKMPNTEVMWLTDTTPCAISAIPPGYGADRIAADIGAYQSQHALLVIDAGTCITYDLIIDGKIEEGVISPGVQLRLNAMHDYTAALPAIDAKEQPTPPLMANDTVGCMMAAAIHGTRFEIEGYITALRHQHPNLEVIITGGNHFKFSSNINCTYDPLLVMRGLMKL